MAERCRANADQCMDLGGKGRIPRTESDVRGFGRQMDHARNRVREAAQAEAPTIATKKHERVATVLVPDYAHPINSRP